MTMSYFGKRRNLNNEPPAPPRRTDHSAGFEWPQDEFEDDEEGDMYEVPPCERAPLKVPPSQVQDDIYLERSSNPTVPQRGVAPPPHRAGKSPKTQQEEFFNDSTIKKPPEIDRTEKPGRKMRPPPAARPAPSLVPATEDDDVYLDPNVEQEDNDVYLEPEAACPPPRRGPVRVPPPSPKEPPPPKPMMKPSVPRTNTQPVFPSTTEKKSTEDRRFSGPRVAPPAPGVKPLLKDPKPTPPVAQMPDTKSVGGHRMSRSSGNEDKEWFAGDCSRKDAEDLLQRIKKDGAFLIRHSSNQSSNQRFTLALLYQQKVYNIPIRFLEETQSYALGKEGKKNEEVFSSLDEMISYHRNHQILLIDSRSQAKHTANLTQAVRP